MNILKRLRKHNAVLLGVTAVMLTAALINKVGAQSYVELTTNAQQFGADVIVLGTAGDKTSFPFQVALKMRNVSEFHARLGRGEEIPNDVVEQRYLPTVASYQMVLSWLRVNGIAVTQTYANRVTVEAVGSVGAVRAALHVSFKRVMTDGAEFAATDAAPVVPGSIADVIVGVNGLQPYRHLDKLDLAKSGPLAIGATTVDRATVISRNYAPVDILRVYQARPYLTENGRGTTTAILTDTFPHRSDLEDFWSLTRTPQSLSNIAFIQTVRGVLPQPSSEATLDTEWSSSIGYGSKVRVYAPKKSLTDLDTGYQAILKDLNDGVSIEQLSLSFGGCEAGTPKTEITTQNNLLSLIAAKNVSIFVASGDRGSREAGDSNPPCPSWPSTSPFVTAVGGTHLIARVVSKTRLAIAGETGWTRSGGGVSTVFIPPPSYQAFLGLPSRAVPDVAADADPATGVMIVFRGKSRIAGGTSVSTPIWAGFASLINQARVGEGKKPLGQLNPRIYPLLGFDDLHDIIEGCTQDFCAKEGYDLVTGLGSPVMRKLLVTLVNQP